MKNKLTLEDAMVIAREHGKLHASWLNADFTVTAIELDDRTTEYKQSITTYENMTDYVKYVESSEWISGPVEARESHPGYNDYMNAKSDHAKYVQSVDDISRLIDVSKHYPGYNVIISIYNIDHVLQLDIHNPKCSFMTNDVSHDKKDSPIRHIVEIIKFERIDEKLKGEAVSTLRTIAADFYPFAHVIAKCEPLFPSLQDYEMACKDGTFEKAMTYLTAMYTVADFCTINDYVMYENAIAFMYRDKLGGTR